MDDDLEIAVEVIQPMRHNRWAVIVPALAFAANVAGDMHQLFAQYTSIAAQHGMQKHYDRKFREVVNGGHSGLRSGEVLPED
jgi:hypothetical protein